MSSYKMRKQIGSMIGYTFEKEKDEAPAMWTNRNPYLPKKPEPKPKPKVSLESVLKAVEEASEPTIEDPVTKFTAEIRTKFNLEFEEAVTQAFRTVASGLEVDIYVNPEIVYKMLKKHKKRKPYYNVRCPECYAEIETGQQYCSHCGQALEW